MDNDRERTMRVVYVILSIAGWAWLAVAGGYWAWRTASRDRRNRDGEI